MNKRYIFLLAGLMASYYSNAQSKLTTTGNNTVNPSDPYAADVVIGSDAGTRHDSSIMWWSNGSASRISNTNDAFYFSVWNTTNPNIALAATVGSPSYFQGNLGIGTTDTQGYKLAVNGNIHTQEIRVDMSNWPDYVFKPSYRLPPLAEVKTYIDRNGHLPEVPSEKEIAQNGIELGKMNKLLMKKVEELTLYLMAQQKVNQSLQQQIDDIAKQVIKK